jgi:serine protease Do
MKRALARDIGCRTAATLALVLLAAVPSAALAQPAGGDASALTPLKLPAVFGKSDPQSLADARAIESHVVKLVDHVRPVTVALRVGRAFGSGVIVSEDGVILTAGHVIGEPGRRVEVTMSDGSRVQAVSLGRNRAVDSGMIQLPKDRKWKHADLAPADSIKAGSWSLAMGHPGGYDAERGVVTRLGRVIASRKRFIQTDCELVGGDSGGPLFDMAGRVIAVHSRIGESANFNFHVPAAVYREEWERLVAGEDFAGHSGALLGVTGVASDGGRGLRITTVHTGEPAEKAGVKVGDVLVLFDGKEVKSLDKLIELVGERMPGQTVIAEIVRDGRSQRFKIELGMRWD